MALRRIMLVVILAVSAGTARAQTVKLEEAALVDSCYRIRLQLDLKGKITFQQDGKPQVVEHTAVAEHGYLERILEAKGGSPQKTVRLYETAKAAIAGQTRTLRPERTFMLAHRQPEQLVTYSPKGPLTLEEMELTEHFDTLAVPGLLPGKEIKVGESWPLPNAVAQHLCGFDAVEKHDLTGTLVSVADGAAQITVQGTAKGIDLGAQVATLITKSKIVFDVKQQRVTALEWTQSDQRQQGPASPALSADVTIKLTRTPLAETPSDLNDFALARTPSGAPPANLTNIAHRDVANKFSMQHSRDWQFIGERNGQRVLRLITSRGDWVADATLMRWKGPKLDADGFKQLLEGAPGWMQETESKVDADVKHPNGCSVVRVSASGKIEGVAAFRTSYYLTNEQGEQMIVTFVAAPNQVNNLDSRDQTLVDNIELK